MEPSPSPTSTPAASFWDQAAAGLPSIIVGGLTIAFGALIIWLASIAWRRLRGPRPTLLLKLEMGNAWTVRNVTKRTLLNAEWIAVGPTGLNLSESYNSLGLPDFAPDSPIYLGSFEPGSTLVFMWISGDRRRRAEVKIREGDEEIPVVPHPLPKKKTR